MAYDFSVVMIGYSAVNILDVMIRLMRFWFPKIKYLMALLMLINFLAAIGFFIAMHVVRFRGAGLDCSEALLFYRGSLLKVYIIAAWSFAGLSIIATLIYVLV